MKRLDLNVSCLTMWCELMSEAKPSPQTQLTTTAALRERAGKKTTGNKTRDSGHMSGWYFKKKKGRKEGRKTKKQTTEVPFAKLKGARGMDQLHQGDSFPRMRGEERAARRSEISLSSDGLLPNWHDPRRPSVSLLWSLLSSWERRGFRLSAKARSARRRSSGRGFDSGAVEGLKSLVPSLSP
uniref:Uncharacterized protein n=1 Tax=Micrurus carvalhoi TaxID=3147026 RepID=A0A2H6MWU5_9SAUR